MAHVQKFNAKQLGHILDHCEREGGCRNREEQNIDWSRTHLNYGLSNSDRSVHDRILEVYESQMKQTGKAVRKDAVLVCDWVVTLPKDCDEREKFFEETFAFISERYGSENCFGYVHMDETTPHMHCCVVPEKDGKFCAKNVVSRRDLQTFHKDLQEHLDLNGVQASVLLDEEDLENKALSHVPQKDLDKARKAYRRELIRGNEYLQARHDSLEEDCNRLEQRKTDLQASCDRLETEIDGLERKRVRYRAGITAQALEAAQGVQRASHEEIAKRTIPTLDW